MCLYHTPAGDPKYTHSDVEPALQKWMRGQKVTEMVTALLDRSVEAEERAELVLLAKYPDG